MAPKKNQNSLIQKATEIATVVGLSSTEGKIENTTTTNGSSSSGSEEIDSKSQAFTTLPVMVVDATSVDEQLAHLAQAVANLQKIVEDKDMKIAQLMDKLEQSEVGEFSPKHESYPLRDEKAKQVEEAHPKPDFVQGATHSSMSVATLSVQQLQEMIANTIKAQYGGPSQVSPMYSKPYTKRIDALRMPAGYQPPKLQQFDGKGNPKQHIAHFIETCNNAGTNGDLLVKQFVRSLKGNAFDWYVDLKPESINSWEEMEHEFLNRFYSTRRTVSMIELTNAKQWKDEPVVDYINRWRALSLNCKDKLSEVSAIEMCIQGMHWGLLYILQAIKPRNFEELATRAHDMELSIANHKSALPLDGQKGERKDFKRNEKFSKTSTKESMAIKAVGLKIPSKNEDDKTGEHRISNDRRRPTLKEMQEKEYPFPESDVSHIFDELLARKLIDLPEPKRPEEVGMMDDPKYCKYHRVVGHPIGKCFVVKEKIMRLARDGKIILDTEDVAYSNVTSVTSLSSDTCPASNTQKCPPAPTKKVSAFQFGSLEPQLIRALFHEEKVIHEENPISAIEDEGEWILVTRRQRQRGRVDKLHVMPSRNPQPIKYIHHAKSNKGSKVSDDASRKSYGSSVHKHVTLKEFFPKEFFMQKVERAYVNSDERDHQHYIPCCAAMTFTDDDLLLGSKPHNRPLVDGGSAVNILPKSTMRQLGIATEDLSRSRLTIQGFNQEGQRAIGMVRLDLTIEELAASTLFHVIDARTSYHLLLGRPWLHENGIVPSTLHQCFKYLRNGEMMKVDANAKPFTEAGSHFADAKLYLESNLKCETVISKAPVCHPINGSHMELVPTKIGCTKDEKVATSVEAPMSKNDGAVRKLNLPVFRCAPQSRRGSQILFIECTTLLEDGQERPKEQEPSHCHLIREGLIMPIIDLGPLARKQTHDVVPQSQWPREAYDPRSYNLLAKSGYNFSNPSRLGELKPGLTGEKIHGLNETQRTLRRQGFRVNQPRVGLGFTPIEPVRIRVSRKGECANVHHITIKGVGNQKKTSGRISAFDRIGAPTTQSSVFERKT
ncbi:PREDICTED: uncharacterized protein LOC105959033 [Erythranthe guttata]|uniref:uncharacterized protein LOC105959033 n=1 Tax=Erythranthe guttata TaxID=4155 RepID=UPI00064D99EA|nr:PREDICTED: uncharacterized protein LOC105959033 [Erythranthe guttata]|eukprot:XP_012838511.1 PREDICTED: uncharacterized protein LOC105959033 [Erythranthe guttata]